MSASESCSSIIFIVKTWHSKGTGRSPGSSVGCESLQPAKRNAALSKDRLDVILEVSFVHQHSYGLVLLGHKAHNGAVCCEAL